MGDYTQLPKPTIVAGWFYFLFLSAHTITIMYKTHRGKTEASWKKGNDPRLASFFLSLEYIRPPGL